VVLLSPASNILGDHGRGRGGCIRGVAKQDFRACLSDRCHPKSNLRCQCYWHFGYDVALDLSALSEIKPVQDYEDQVRIPLGLWLKRNTPEGSLILLEPIGYIGYYSERRVLDAVALISPQVLPYYQGDLYFPYNLPNVALALRPDYCVFRYPDEFDGFRDNPLRTEFEELYKPILRVAEFVVLERVR
jgi:hypothetical protein